MATAVRSIPSLGPSWKGDSRVRCFGIVDFMYPTQPSSEVSLAKEVCNGIAGVTAPCYYRNECLAYALDHKENFGVWGGTSERERRRMLRARTRFNNPHIYSLEDIKFPNIVFIKPQAVNFIKRRTAA